MADPNLNHVFVFDDQGLVDVLHSPFSDINFGNDHTVEEYMDQILFSLATAIDQRRPPVQWQLSHRPPVTSFLDFWTSPVACPGISASPTAVQKKVCCCPRPPACCPVIPTGVRCCPAPLEATITA
ncbi:hypothetical protein M5K25_024594 [Dendrobium thyrsiflorum]|uniref:Uncharacterized protein n=1 Tax=Dendrobium thyrsiflorum TaxID=117978 RepID=A0ABD0U2B2_DENTH